MKGAPSALVAAALLCVGLAGCTGEAHPPNAYVASPPALPGGNAWPAKLVAALGDPGSSGQSGWTPQFDAPAAAYDIDGDGVDELVAQGHDSFVYVFRSLTGQILARLPTRLPPAWHIERVLNAVVVDVLAAGEPPSLVVTNHAAYVSVWRYDSAGSTPERLAFTRQFEQRMTACHRNPSMDAAATVADLQDGGKAILVQTEEVGFYALRPDGSTIWQKCWGGGNCAAVVADLDGDGRPEAVFASDGGVVSVLDAATGRTHWTFDARKEGVYPASISVSPTVAELDGQSPKEILFAARNARPGPPSSYENNHLALFAIRTAASGGSADVVWVRQPDWGNPMSYTRLVVQDVDDDGRPDIFGMDWNTIGHYPGDWERLGPAHVFRLDAAGHDVWVREIDAFWSNKDIALADLGGAGPSLVVNGPQGALDGLWQLSARTGMRERFLGLLDWQVERGPQFFDLRHDGSQQLVFPASPTAGSPRGVFLVFNAEA